eukprot:c7630_g1_i2.p1 GENE.c7630_g1_i2~~c7630_g1_i2.p1  ORF type:complete len:242 (-),score=33.57 c7630_g1_i2:1441-2166(-)
MQSTLEYMQLLYSRRPTWVPDSQCRQCSHCSSQFHFFRRRHHCRHCGLIYDQGCSNHFIPLPDLAYFSPVRVCKKCCRELMIQSHKFNQPLNMVSVDDATDTGLKGIPEQWEKALKAERISRDDARAHPDEVLAALQMRYPVDPSGRPYPDPDPEASVSQKPANSSLAPPSSASASSSATTLPIPVPRRPAAPSRVAAPSVSSASAAPKWKEIKDEMKAAGKLREEDPFCVFENITKVDPH